MSGRPSVLLKSLRDQKWQVLGFGVALFSMAAVIIFIWPAYKDSLATLELPPAVQAFLGSELTYASAPGFVSGEFFSWIPALLIVYAIIQGTGAIAGEESSGTIDLLMAQPLSRRRMVLEKCLASVAGSVLIVAIGYLGFLVSLPFVDIDLTLADTAVACANMLPIALLFFGLSLWLGVVAPNRGYAAGAATAVAVAAYFINAIATGVDAVSGLRYASPFYYYGAGLPLIEGIDWPHVGLLLGLALLFTAGAMRAFERRDISIGGATGVGARDLLRRALA